MQDLHWQNIGWDDKIGMAEERQWTKRLTELQALADVWVDRCIVPEEFGSVKTVELHHFADASQIAYGAKPEDSTYLS